MKWMNKKAALLLLFLAWIIVGGECTAAPCTSSSHEYKAKILKYADPDNDGVREYKCIHCGDTYTEAIPRTGHVFGEYHTTQKADCANEGVEVRECVQCGKKESRIIPFSEQHKYKDWVVISESTCTSKGVRQRSCRICGKVQEETFGGGGGHNYEESTTPADCTTDGLKKRVCTRCGRDESEVLPALGHIWGEPVIKKEATETAEGLQVRICERNETHVLEEVIPMLEKAQAAQPVVEAASEETAAEPEPEPVKPAVNKLDVVLGTTNTGMFFSVLFPGEK